MTADAPLTDTRWQTLTTKIMDACAALACYTEVEGETNRPFLCPTTHQVHEYLTHWADELGMTTYEDAAGNLRSRLAGPTPDARTLYLGSHLDTVPNAGAYDGILGVVMGYAMLEAVKGEALPYAVEVMGFSEEEGVRYGVPFIGSRALVGTVDDMLELCDAAGQSVRDAITEYGLNVEEMAEAQYKGAALGYFEIHAEQGPVLQDQGASLGVVEGIAGQNRLLLHFVGQASHAGTTPMNLRRDALAAAARFAVAAEDLARSTPGLVATVGVMQALPGAMNVIPGEANCTLDIRHARDEVRLGALKALLETAETASAERGVTVTITPKMEEKATPMSGDFKALLHRAAEAEGLPHPELVSGAGHDAMIMAAHMPSAMLFVRSPNALSHHPDELVLPEDVTDALRVSVRFLHLLAEQNV
ncbi:allantoate amidohydrolase [Deinococcus detaillensis]|uniref:Allantoate amidohydrolase n=1 Tax=Deinococcus detaillensis TaxID=2592048 RepID=A0A553V4U8_9DEIO|nr:allantoate amidohydrolase [Deinococcus detaillensis]TSA87508.1 allantoate amidohydrolase [Deinococcus detaillensis]